MEFNKIAVRGGHNEQATGASSEIMNELVEDRKVKDAVIKYLKQGGAEVLDVTPSACDSGTDLNYGTDKANNWGADLFVSCHFNNCYGYLIEDALGNEVCVYSECGVGQRVCDAFDRLGFKHRGQKVEGDNLHELRETNMTAIILEPCFVESKADVSLYRKIGADKLGLAIAEAILNKKIEEEKFGWIQDNRGWWYRHENGSYTQNNWEEINGEWYYFDGNGYALENKWEEINGEWYYFDEKCKALKNKWLEWKNEWYWFNDSCKMVKDNISVIYGQRYLFDKDGKMLKNMTLEIQDNGVIQTK